jgi:shikimate kinase
MTQKEQVQRTSSTDVAFKYPRKMSRLMLTGFMGAGKSTVGELLAGQIHWAFLDVDKHIEQSAGATAANLFAALGVPGFRSLESDALSHALGQSDTVVALGGAAIDLPRNQQLLALSPDTMIVFLDAPFATLIERCQQQAQRGDSTYRPLLKNLEVAHARFMTRRSLYTAHCHLTIDVAKKNPNEVAIAIQHRLRDKKGRD